MAGLICPMCNNATINPEVHLMYKNQFLKCFQSALKAMNYALDTSSTPCILRYIYTCQKCGYEDIKLERYYDEKLSDDYYLRKLRN